MVKSPLDDKCKHTPIVVRTKTSKSVAAYICSSHLFHLPSSRTNINSNKHPQYHIHTWASGLFARLASPTEFQYYGTKIRTHSSRLTELHASSHLLFAYSLNIDVRAPNLTLGLCSLSYEKIVQVQFEAETSLNDTTLKN